MDRIYFCIDLKSFYASVECRERNLDPLTTNLVVADSDRTDKTVCLAVTPSLKAYGIGGRARLYEVRSKLRSVNLKRREDINYHKFTFKSYNDLIIKKNKYAEVDFIIAKPRMRYYMKYSANIYDVYLKYIDKKDIVVYSIDEVFIDATSYLSYYKLTPKELITKIIKDVYDTTGITATGGIGTNLFLAKVAMDVVSKHVNANAYGVRIASLDILSYRKLLWGHKPITDIWRVGKGTANTLSKYGIYTMGDIARTSINNEELLYKLFGVNAEILIDHAWGYEPCLISFIKNYKPRSKSIGSGQVLHIPYSFDKTLIVVKEMCDSLSLELVRNGYKTKQIALNINYDICNLKDGYIRELYEGDTVFDNYGRKVPKPSHGTINIDHYTSSSTTLIKNIVVLYNRITNPYLYIRKISLSFNNLLRENEVLNENKVYQLDLFSDNNKKIYEDKKMLEEENKDLKIQKALIDIKSKYGSNSILKGIDYLDYATGIERNKEVGGHHE